MSGDKQKQILYGAGIFLALILFTPYLGLNLLSSGRLETQSPLGAGASNKEQPTVSRSVAQPVVREERRPAAPRRREAQKPPSGGHLSEIEELLKN